MKKINYGDKVHWTEGSQLDKMTHEGIVIKIKTIVSVADRDGYVRDVDGEELKRGWAK